MSDKTFTAIRKEIILKEFESGKITLEEGGDGVYLRFDCACLDALPYCCASCCAIPGITLTHTEALSELFSFDVNGLDTELCRRADGYCVYNHFKDHRCTVYKDRPATCQNFHCTKSVGMRGWKLALKRQENL